jgi:hypothetical protein
MHNRNLFLTVLEVRKSKIKVPAHSVSVKGSPFCLKYGTAFDGSTQGGKGKLAPFSHFYESTNPIHQGGRPYDIITSQKAPPLNITAL